MREPYRKAVRAHVPAADAKIVFDKFHVMQHVGDAVDQVRKQEHRALAATGDTRLKGTQYAWLQNSANCSRKAWREFKALRESSLKSAREWALKESLRKLWDYTYLGAGRTFFRRCYGWDMRSRPDAMRTGGVECHAR